MPEFHSEPYLHIGGLSHKSALIAWGAFYFRVHPDRGMKLVDDDDLQWVHPPRHETIGARSAPYGPARVEVRDASGKVVAEAMTNTANHCIVSGLARGIDTTAHRGAMRGGGKTVGVLGTGIDGAYPKENARLIKEILDSGGAVVSQFPLGTPPLKDNFPYRNRIISGLSLGVLIVEASERSGSLITARLAMEQNREVMAVPGNITSANSYGTNYLIKSGAKLVQQWQDVVAELPSEIAAAILPPKVEEEDERDEKRTPPDLSSNELKIWSLLSYDEPVHIDVLLHSSGMSFGDLNTALVALDIRDMIRVLPGKNYAKRT